MSNTATQAADSIRDELDIQRVLFDINTGVDRMDWDLLTSRYAPDANVDFGDFSEGPVSDYLDFMRSPEGLPSLERSIHQMSNVTVDISGDEARAESYVVAYMSGPKDHPWAAGFLAIYMRYLDRLQRRDGCWVVVDRKARYEWGRNETTGELMSLPPAKQGRRDRSDTRYEC